MIESKVGLFSDIDNAGITYGLDCIINVNKYHHVILFGFTDYFLKSIKKSPGYGIGVDLHIGYGIAFKSNIVTLMLGYKKYGLSYDDNNANELYENQYPYIGVNFSLNKNKRKYN